MWVDLTVLRTKKKELIPGMVCHGEDASYNNRSHIKFTHYLAIHIQNVDIFFIVGSSRLTYNAFQVWKNFFVLFEDLRE